MLAPLRPSPMATRPDTTALLACEDRGMPAIIAATADDNIDCLIGDALTTLYPSVTIGGRLIRSTIAN